MQSTLNDADSVWRQLAPLLEDAMTRLSEKDRALLALRFFENKTGAETAALLGLEESAAHKRSARALEKLRKYFSRHGVISTPALIAAALTAHSVTAAPATLAPAVTALALTKGAAGATSTLTLVHGALKLMAWTKLKTAAITTTLLLIATLGTVAVVHHARHAPPRQTGRLRLPTGPITPMVRYGYSHNLLLLASDGSLWSCGEQRLSWPVLGLSNTNLGKTTEFRRIGHDADWVSIAAGDSHSLAIKADGTLWAWGGNYSFQLGDGTKITRPTPVPSAPGYDWKQAAAGGDNSYAIKNDGTLWAWGDNWSGQLGLPTDPKNYAIIEATQVGTATNWTKIWAGSIQTIGLQADGTLWFWGSLTGDGSDTNRVLLPTRISPDTNWVDACFGYFTMLAIKSDGTLWAWGNEANYYTGLPEDNGNATPQQVGTGTDWVSCASSPGCLYHILTKKDGSLWALDASEHRWVKPANQYKPLKILPLKVPKNIATDTAGGDNIGVVLTREGEVWTWGNVLGEHALSDYEGANHQPKYPKLRVLTTPWQVSNEE